jgi:hypothetical protein
MVVTSLMDEIMEEVSFWRDTFRSPLSSSLSCHSSQNHTVRNEILCLEEPACGNSRHRLYNVSGSVPTLLWIPAAAQLRRKTRGQNSCFVTFIVVQLTRCKSQQ